jgi:glyceraldehyde 3-phosphate dehydrogenase
MRIAVNGMGRIGRLLTRRLLTIEGIELVAVNDIMPPDNLAYLLRYDSVYGTLMEPVTYGDGHLTIGRQRFAAFQTEHPAATRRLSI